MSRYFFDITDNGSTYLDHTGIECASEGAAQVEAARALGGMARDALVDDGGDREMAISVRDAQGRPCVQVRLQYTVRQES